MLLSESKFEWTDQQQDAFEHLKETLVSPEVLQVPVAGHTYLLKVDCSYADMGCLLSQVDESGCEYHVAFESKAFKTPPKVGCSAELELFGIVLAILTFKHYLTGEWFKVHSDSSGAIGLIKPKAQQAKPPSKSTIRLLEKLTICPGMY